MTEGHEHDDDEHFPWATPEEELDECLTLNVWKKGAIYKHIPLGEFPSFVIGRGDAHILLEHPSISREHAVIVHGSPDKTHPATIIDLGSSHGTFLSETIDCKRKKRLTKRKPYPLDFEKHFITFGSSSRVYTVADYATGKVNPASSQAKLSTTPSVAPPKKTPDTSNYRDAKDSHSSIGKMDVTEDNSDTQNTGKLDEEVKEEKESSEPAVLRDHLREDQNEDVVRVHSFSAEKDKDGEEDDDEKDDDEKEDDMCQSDRCSTCVIS